MKNHADNSTDSNGLAERMSEWEEVGLRRNKEKGYAVRCNAMSGRNDPRPPVQFW